MFLAELLIENFRVFGEGQDALTLSLKPGLTALVGENDTGKTAVMDAIRFALGTRDQEFMRVEESDFHQPPDGAARKTEIRVRCKFADLSPSDIAAFTEYLTYDTEGGVTIPVLYINWSAVGGFRGSRRFITVETRSGRDADGPSLDPESRVLLCATYLRPLRDAERALSAGRGSRLSQILQHTKEIKEHGGDYDHANPPDRPVDTQRSGDRRLRQRTARRTRGHSKCPQSPERRIPERAVLSRQYAGRLHIGQRIEGRPERSPASVARKARA